MGHHQLCSYLSGLCLASVLDQRTVFVVVYKGNDVTLESPPREGSSEASLDMFVPIRTLAGIGLGSEDCFCCCKYN